MEAGVQLSKIKVFNSLRVKIGIIAVILIAIPVFVISFTYSTNC